MAKLIAGVLKKLPVPGVEFSNQQFSGGLEVELPDDADGETIQQRLRELYALLSATVEVEIAAATEAARAAGPEGATLDSRRRGYERESGERGYNRGYDREDRDRGSQRDYDGGRGNYRGQNARDDRHDDGRRSNNSWRERNGGNGGRVNGNGRGGAATQAQVKAVFGIAKGRGIERRDLLERVEDQFGVRRVEDLDVRQASRLIEELKAA
ncbi:MAG: hypothetical protein FWG74_08865 [Planctomycetes bacterium]|nr:hypothetical protein [Planctomycetota bacterium]